MCRGQECENPEVIVIVLAAGRRHNCRRRSCSFETRLADGDRVEYGLITEARCGVGYG